MEQQDEIEALLRKAAPVCHSVATGAQKAAADIMATQPVALHLTRTAAFNQVGGMAQWRLVGDGLVRRHADLPSELQLSTTDSEQNQGFYYFKSTSPALVLTIRRQPHPESDRPDALQLQMQEVIDVAGADFGGEVVTAYLVVPAFRGEPQFEVIAKGESLVYQLRDLFDDQDGTGNAHATIRDLPRTPSPGTVVKSMEDDEQEDADSTRS